MILVIVIYGMLYAYYKNSVLMNMSFALDKCVSHISSELQAGNRLPSPNHTPRPVVTLSRQCGSGAHTIGQKLAAYLEVHAPEDSCPWKVYDSNLVTRVLAEHKMPRRFARFMPEDRASELADAMDELLGAHPPSSVLVSHTKETILRLAERGNVILIGRAANLVTSHLEHALHVRLVAPLEQRIEHFRRSQDINHSAAQQLVRHEDRGRRRYVKHHFDADLEDPLLYHLVINTGLVSFENAARLIGDMVLKQRYYLER